MKTIKNLFLTEEELDVLKKYEIDAHNGRTGLRIENDGVDFLTNTVGTVFAHGKYEDLKKISDKIRFAI